MDPIRRGRDIPKGSSRVNRANRASIKALVITRALLLRAVRVRAMAKVRVAHKAMTKARIPATV